MKKILTTLLWFIAFHGASAQFINQGSIMAGGSVYFISGSSKVKTGSTTISYGHRNTFTIAPEFGYFIINNLALGADLSLSFSKHTPDDANDDRSKYTSIQVSPFMRYYLSKGIFFEGQIGAGSGISKSTTPGNTTREYKLTSTNWSLTAGYASFITNNIAIEPMLGYAVTITDDKNFTAEDESINSSFLFKIGLQIYLRKSNPD
jgi:hypothetical protein